MNRRFALAVVTLSGWIIGPACQSIVGIEDRVEAPPLDSTSADASSATDSAVGADADADPCAANPTSCLAPDAAPPANCPASCLPPAPEGWKGPSATYDGAEATKPAACPTGYTEKEVDAHQGMTAAAATCDCGTPVIKDRRCTFSVRDCNGGGIIAKVSGCGLVDDPNNLFSFKLDSPFFSPGSCTYPNQKTVAPAPSFAKTNVACGLPQVSACVADGSARPDCVAVPVPDQPYGKVCIHKDGELPCPSADYANRFVAYKKVDDTRTCSACSGSVNAGGSCGTKWSIRSNLGQCDIPNLTPDKDLGTCYSSADGSEFIDTNTMQPGSGTCTTTAGTPSGVASSVEPVTFCCNL